MNHKILDNNNKEEITNLFTSVFTSSAGEKEGELVGNLASELSSNIDNQEIICLGTYENESLIGSIFFTPLRFNENIQVYMLAPVAVSTQHQRKGVGFVNGSWLDVFKQYILPSVSQQIVYQQAVNAIDYSADKVLVATQNGHYSADKVIVTVPLKMLQVGHITFSPPLPNHQLDAIKKANIWEGIKVFIEFSSSFYPTFTDIKTNPDISGEQIYYDAAYGQNTSKNILGFLAVGTPAKHYIDKTSRELKDYLLNELDTLFANQATPNYKQHIVQNWSKTPFIEGAYLADNEDSKRVITLSETVSDKLYFAGEAYTSGTDWGSVHATVQSARETVEEFI